ncbi:MAG: STAS domain-containing protein [Planctomycetota bacterium]|nr:STAS domain-containing protein [Planctomycetota bacterium]
MFLQIGKKYPEITGPMSDAFSTELNEVLERSDFSELVLDFNGTKIINSMAMGALFSVNEKLKQHGKSLSIINAGEKVTHLLHMVNMDELLQS